MKHVDKAVDYKTLGISSTAFRDGEMIPAKYTCDGINVNPPLDIKNVPENAICLALIVDDPDAPVSAWTHWLVWNMPVTQHIKEDTVHGVEGLNDFQQQHYGGPCPPSGIHRYFFKVYALDALLELPANTKKLALERAMSNHIIAFGELVGLYQRQKKGNKKV
jgi:Raf kinase inhibitor-like YbhB/YbcL family protein